MLNGIFERSLQDVNTVVCRATSARPPLPTQQVLLHSILAVILLPHLAPVSCGFCRERSPPSTSLTHSTHSASDLYRHDLLRQDQVSHLQQKNKEK